VLESSVLAGAEESAVASFGSLVSDPVVGADESADRTAVSAVGPDDPLHPAISAATNAAPAAVRALRR
jgi:hypothetical protein